MRGITQMFLLCGIVVLIAACGGGGGGGVSSTGEIESVAMSTTSEAEDSATEMVPEPEDSTTETIPEAEDSATETIPEAEDSATETIPEAEDSTTETIPEAEDSATEMVPEAEDSTTETVPEPGDNLNGGSSTSTSNRVPRALPSSYFNGRNALKAEASKSSPDANLHLNHTQVFGKHEGKAAQNPGDEDNEPGTWMMATSCVDAPGPGKCYVFSNRLDSFHVIVTEEGELHPYYGALYRRYSDGRIETCFRGGPNCVVASYTDVALAVPLGNDTSHQPIATVNGVKMVQTRGIRRGARTIIESGVLIDSPVDFVGYGAWMDHTGFFAESYLYDDTGNGRKQESAAWALGIRTTGSPPLPATGTLFSWKGAMAGVVVHQDQRRLNDPYTARDFDPVRGDTEVTMDDAGELRIAITNIFYLNQSGSIPDFVWGSDDVFGAPVYDENSGVIVGFHSRMTAAFYGPNHEEVAGVFENRIVDNDWLIGAFGAKRVR